MGQLQPLIERMIEGWRNENIPILPGVDSAVLADFESRYQVKLPADMHEFYSTVNGMGDHYDEKFFFRFWPIEQVALVKDYSREVAKAFPEWDDSFLFFDHSIDIFMHAIQLNRTGHLSTPIAMVYPETPVSSASFDPFCDSFAAFLTMYVDDPGNLL